MAREKAEKPPVIVKTDGLRSYVDALPRVFPTHMVNHMVSQGVNAEINNNLSERLQGTLRDRDKTLRGLKSRAAGQAYVDGRRLRITAISGHMRGWTASGLSNTTARRYPVRRRP